MRTPGFIGEHQPGTLVALEGGSEQISTQLQLLPHSSKILILPPLEQELDQSNEDEFDARSYIRECQTAYMSRAETARSFLQESTPEQPRLVFMNGGAVRARTACLAQISDHITDGDVNEADRLFRDIVKDGVAGLYKTEQDVEEEAFLEDRDETSGTLIDESRSQTPRELVGESVVPEIGGGDDANGELNSNTDQLSEGDEMGIPESTERPTPGSWPLKDDPEVQSPDESNIDENTVEVTVRVPSAPGADPSPDPKIGQVLEIGNKGNVIKTTTIKIPTRHYSIQERRRKIYGPRPLTPYPPLTTDLPRQDQSEDFNKASLMSPADNHSAPPTPGLVEYGEAFVVDLQALKRSKTLPRVKSVDRLYLGDDEGLDKPKASKSRARAASVGNKAAKKAARHTSAGSVDSLQRGSFVRASQTTIRRSPTLLRLSSPNRVFVDRGTDPAEFEGQDLKDANAAQTTDKETESFQAVFDILEDLIICFSDAKNKQIFDFVVESYKSGTYPSLPRDDSLPSLSESHGDSDEPQDDSDDQRDVDEKVRAGKLDEHDPFNPDTYVSRTYRSFPLKTPTKEEFPLAKIDAPMSAMGSPAPIPTPTSTPSGPARKFQDFSPVNASTALAVQNALRSLLEDHFPSADKTYSQYEYPLENDRVWKPMFQSQTRQGSDGPSVDLIVAVGCEDGVDREFFNEISVQIEKFGLKKNGVNRTGRLDMRYLIANAMQTFTSLPLATQTHSNPFSDPTLLATLILPHLESYLTSNEPIRFLVLSYSATQLATVLAMRKLIGADLLKVAGIIDSFASDPPSRNPKSRRSKSPTSLHALSTQSERLLSSRQRLEAIKRQVVLAQSRTSSPTSTGPNSNVIASFARCNFVLPSAATDSEISSFLSNIWRCLIEKSEFYIPEPIDTKPRPQSQAQFQQSRPQSRSQSLASSQQFSRPSSSRGQGRDMPPHKEDQQLRLHQHHQKPPTPPTSATNTMDIDYHHAVLAEQASHRPPTNKMRLVNGIARDSGFPKSQRAVSTHGRTYPHQPPHQQHRHTSSRGSQIEKRSLYAPSVKSGGRGMYFDEKLGVDGEDSELEMEWDEKGEKGMELELEGEETEEDEEHEAWERKFIPRWVSSGNIHSQVPPRRKDVSAALGISTGRAQSRGVNGAATGTTTGVGMRTGRGRDVTSVTPGSGGRVVGFGGNAGSRKALRWLGLA